MSNTFHTINTVIKEEHKNINGEIFFLDVGTTISVTAIVAKEKVLQLGIQRDKGRYQGYSCIALSEEEAIDLALALLARVGNHISATGVEHEVKFTPS